MNLPVQAQMAAPEFSSFDFELTEQAASAYHLGPGDQLDITVFDYTEFSGTHVVLPDGTISLPMIGTIAVAGQTTAQLADELQTRLEPLLVNPVVSVSLSVLRPVRVTVAGEVRHPGPLQLRSLTTTNLTIGGNTIEGTPTVSAALTEAGGITQDADIRQIVLRRYGMGDDTEPTVINLWDAIATDNPSQDQVLQDGDVIYVPRRDPNEPVDRRLIARAQFSPETVRVRVIGEVNNPGEIQMPPDGTIASAVAIAGGPTEDARLSDVTFVRMDETGQIEQQELDLRTMTDTNQVQEGDVIIVPKRGSASILDFAGRLLPPLNFLINLFGG